jgi:hypothetical protein
VVNTEHPLIVEFEEFCTALTKLAELKEAQREIRGHLTHLTNYLKHASLAGDAYTAATRASAGAGSAVRPLVEKALGPTAGRVAQGAISHAPNAALGLAGMEAYTHLKHSPNPVAKAVRGTGKLVAQNIPGTEAHLRHKYEVESGQ